MAKAKNNPDSLDLTSRSVMFPANIIQAAQLAMRETGCPASLTLSQWALESGYGKYLSAPNNFFGFKYFPGCPYSYETQLTKEWNGKEFITIEARFISFPTVADAFNMHGKLIMNPNGIYGGAVTIWDHTKDVLKFTQRIASIYATSPTYGQTLIAIMKQYKLIELDIV